MRFGVRLPNSGPFASKQALTQMAVKAEELGYEAVFCNDHLNWSYDDRYKFYAGSREAADAQNHLIHFYESMTTMGYLAGITRRIKIVPSALCLAWRPILLLAREALTLYQITDHRFVLCVCVGNSRRDFEVTGVPWEERGAISIEKLKVLRMILDKPGPYSFEGQYANFRDVELEPWPEGMDLWWAGGSNQLAVRRAARYATGLVGVSPAYFREQIPELRRAAEGVGRGDVNFEFVDLPQVCVAVTDEEAERIGLKTIESHARGEWMQRYAGPSKSRPGLVGSPERVVEGIREYKDAGVTLLGIGFVGHNMESILEQMEMFIRDVVPEVD